MVSALIFYGSGGSSQNTA